MTDLLSIAVWPLLLIIAIGFSPFGFAIALTAIALVRGHREERRS